MSDCFSDKLKQTLMVRLPGATEAAIDLEMGNAAHEWFLESGSWHEIVYANMRANVGEYQLWTEGGTVGYICDLYVDGARYRPISGNTVPRNSWYGAYQILSDFGTLVLSPFPTENKPRAIVANVTVIPDSCACDIPPDILNHYYEALLDTSLGKMYSHINKPYTNASLAAFHIGRYRAHLTRARRIVAGGNLRAGGPWMFPQIAPGKSRRGYGLPRGV